MSDDSSSSEYYDDDDDDGDNDNSSSSSLHKEHDHDNNENKIKVFLRLRPMNKLETSRRSKNCVELDTDQDPTCLTVDSPLEGEYDFFFDRVFEEDTSQQVVYQHSIASVPSQLLEGYNCAVMAYGQTGSGKSHTLMGDSSSSSSSMNTSSTATTTTTTSSTAGHVASPRKANPEARGMIVKIAHDLFQQIQALPASREVIVRCSYVEVYLERILDLLHAHPAGGCDGSDDSNRNGNGMLRIVVNEQDDENNKSSLLPGDKAAGASFPSSAVINPHNVNVSIDGAAELCCLDETDVENVLARGNACRTMSSITEMNTQDHSSRSHAIFILKVQQYDSMTGRVYTSTLQMVDLAGSEVVNYQGVAGSGGGGGGATVGGGGGGGGDASAVQTEAKMVSKSLQALHSCVRAQLEYQQQQHQRAGATKLLSTTPTGYSTMTSMQHYQLSKLTRLLCPAFGGNSKTWLILTASPSSYNIGETISTIRFGQRVKRIENKPSVNVDFSRQVYKKKLKESEELRHTQMAVLKAVALECKRLRNEEEGRRKNEETDEAHARDGPLWDTIDELLASEDAENLDYHALLFQAQRYRTNACSESVTASEDELEKARREIQTLREQLESMSQARDDSENRLSDLESEVAVLRSQNEHLIADKNKDLEELINAKNELQIMSQRKIEVEHNFRTSQFRENEAIVFLRTFRRFYKNVLRDRAAHGSGSLKAITTEISEKVPGALNLDELVDADTLLLEAGLIEEHEMRNDKSAPVYIPSRAALIRSATNAKKAAKELEVLEEEYARNEAADVVAAAPARASEDTGHAGVADAAARKRPSILQRRSSAIRRPSTASVEMVEAARVAGLALDENEQEAIMESEEVVVEDDTENELGAGADAGAGSSTSISATEGAPADAGSLWDQSGIAINKRHQLLGTPSGRFSLMQEKNMERDLSDLADKCIKLEQALKEERATVEILSGRAGGTNKKKLAQEAIQLRQEIEKRTQNLMATAWKMNELNLINKSYKEKMVTREQHVMYLEENYVELQNRNRMIIEQQQETERKLRDELESVHKVLAGMSVSLWQYNERKPTEERSVASRIRTPVFGGIHSSPIDREFPKKRLSDAESEPSVDHSFEQVTPVLEILDSNTQTDKVELHDAQVQTEIAQHQNVCIQTDETPREDVAIMTEETRGCATSSPVATLDSAESGIQTDDRALGNVVGIAAIEATSSDEPSSEDEAKPKLAALGRGISVTGAEPNVAVASPPDDIQKRVSEPDVITDVRARALASSDASRPTSGIVDSFVLSTDSVGGGDGAAAPTAVAVEVDDEAATSVVRVGASKEQIVDMDSADDIEAITRDLAAAEEVPHTVDAASNDKGDEVSIGDGSHTPPLTDGKSSVVGVTRFSVIAAAARVAHEEAERGTTREPPQPASDPKSKDENGETFKAKSIFASTVFSVLNRGSADKKEEVKSKETLAENVHDGIEPYHGDGHSPKRVERTVEHPASSRDEWAAARDDFDSIFAETAQAVNTASLRRKPKIEEGEDPDKHAREFKAIAAKIGHQSEDEIVTMGSKAQLGMNCDEEPRKPWEKSRFEEKRKPWEKSSKSGNDQGSFGESYDIIKDTWYDDSDDESNSSYRYETHVLNRPQTEEDSRPPLVKFLGSTKMREKSTSDDEFDQMMSATQAALGAVEGMDAEKDVEEQHVPLIDDASLTSREESLFTGGRTNSFRPRRSVNRPKIKAGVLKEEKKPSKEKSRSDLMSRNSESRRRLGDGDEKKRRKKKRGKSSRNLTRSKSERHPKRDREHQSRGSRRKSGE